MVVLLQGRGSQKRTGMARELCAFPIPVRLKPLSANPTGVARIQDVESGDIESLIPVRFSQPYWYGEGTLCLRQAIVVERLERHPRRIGAGRGGGIGGGGIWVHGPTLPLPAPHTSYAF